MSAWPTCSMIWTTACKPTVRPKKAKDIQIGTPNSRRCRLWKVSLQELADTLNLAISVCHFPPGTSKWNKIEHRMFCHITENWRGRPLRSRATVVNLIGSTTTTTGLHIEAAVDDNKYPLGIEVT